MPRGDNPNSRKNLTHKGFDTETARKAGQKGRATQKYNASFRAAGRDMLTDEEMAKMWKAMIARAKSGNITAFKTLFDVMGEAAQDVISKEADVNIAFLAPVSPPETPPDDIEEETNE